MTGTIESDKNANLHLPTQEDRDRADKVFQQVLKDGPQERNGKGKFVKGAAVVSTAAAAAAMFAGCTPGIVQPSEMPSQSAITIDPNTGEPTFTPTPSSTKTESPSPSTSPEIDPQKEAEEKLNQQIQDFLNKEGEFTLEKMAEKIIQPVDPSHAIETVNTLGIVDTNPRVEGWLFDYYQMNDDYLLLVVGFDSKDGNRFVTPIEIPLYLYAGYEPAQLVFSSLEYNTMQSKTTTVDDSGDVDKILENVAMLKGGPIVFNLKNKPSPEEWYHKYGEVVGRGLKEADNKIILNKALTTRLVNHSIIEDIDFNGINSIDNIDLIELTKLEDIKNVDITQVPLIYSQIYFFRN